MIILPIPVLQNKSANNSNKLKVQMLLKKLPGKGIQAAIFGYQIQTGSEEFCKLRISYFFSFHQRVGERECSSHKDK